MYNLNYTYLTELEVDTRQTFADLCDDLLLLNFTDEVKPGQNLPETFGKTMTMETLVTGWQDYFWKFDTKEKKNLNVSFTDISIVHSDDMKKDYYNKPLLDEEMMSYRELSAFFKEMDGDGQPGHGKWCGDNHWTFTELCCQLLDAIDGLHTRLLDDEKLYPTGSIIISKYAPSEFGSWENKNQSYISEKISEISGFKIGFNTGKVMNTDVGSSPESIIVKPETTGIPIHEHKIEFDPPEGSGSDSNSSSTGIEADTFKEKKAGLTNSTGWMSGTRTDSEHTKFNALVVPSDTDCSIDIDKKDREAHGDLNAIETEVTSECQRGIHVAPKTYPLNSLVWERKPSNE